MELGLKNKVALVTGCTEGIGFAIAHALSNEGACVYVNGRQSLSVERAIEKLRKMGVRGELRAAPFDLSTQEGTENSGFSTA